ncbi:MAG: hypothetical protein BGO95_06930 [Micrococcales bacterium 73-13]|nr:MAG: hypothetical protein BGO95_06930 [Micrococcales bacterium 73-13]
MLFVPFGLLLSVLFRHSSRGTAYRDPVAGIVFPTVCSLALSLTVEFAQAVFLPARFATVSDLVANTLGGLLGAIVAAPIRPGTRSSPRPVRGALP